MPPWGFGVVGGHHLHGVKDMFTVFQHNKTFTQSKFGSDQSAREALSAQPNLLTENVLLFRAMTVSA